MESKHIKDSSASHLVYWICMTSWQQPASWNSGEKHHCCRLYSALLDSPLCTLQTLWEAPTELIHRLLLVAKAQGLSLFPALQMVQMHSLVLSSMDTGPQTSLPRVGGRGQLSSFCILPVLRQHAWLPFQAALFRRSCPHREQTWPWFAAPPGQHTSPQPTTSVLCQWSTRIRRSCLKGDPSCS